MSVVRSGPARRRVGLRCTRLSSGASSRRSWKECQFMPVDVRVPTLGESIVEATVGAWLKGEGDQVEAGESLVQLETEKVNVDVAADQAGVLGKIAVATGETVRPGDVLATIDESAAGGAA